MIKASCWHRHSPKIQFHAVCFHCAALMIAGLKAKPEVTAACNAGGVKMTYTGDGARSRVIRTGVTPAGDCMLHPPE
jgi:hypothetical protein